MNIAVLRALLFSTLLVLCVVPIRLTHTQAPPNILLIVSDDHAWSDYSFMGHPTIKTPAIDRLAASGRLYTRDSVPTALCRPSLATLLTGFYPHDHGMTGNDPPGGARTMTDPVARATTCGYGEGAPRASRGV